MSKTIVFVGSYTRSPHTGRGISVLKLDQDSGALTLLSEYGNIENPSYLTPDNTGRFLYAVSELSGEGGGKINAFSIVGNFSLTPICERETRGKDPCHVAVSPDNRKIFVTNYSSGSACSFYADDNGDLSELAWFEAYDNIGSLVVEERQKRPHAHSTTFSPCGRYVYVADLGSDLFRGYRLGNKLPEPMRPFASPSGSGPRHAAFSPDGKFLYIVNELSCTVDVCSYCADSGLLELIQTVPTLPSGFMDASTCADIHFTPDGHFLYASNRGHNSLARYRTDSQTGVLELQGFTSTEGRTPRGFAIDDAGRFLISANQDSSNLVVFRIDASDGALCKCFELFLPSPVCVKLFRYI